ncbi:MAG: DUF368 domain-containing protein [Proteobacteria bacterium]|nr:DUF368 domain-containing protein [Pseudomonadota bacterium]
MAHASHDSDETAGQESLLVVRGTVGGVLMGLANLVPGISGGTMLLAAGVYPGFLQAVAELSTLRFRRRSLLLFASIAGSAALAILLLAGTIKELVETQRWIMYSLFIGLTFGGVPLVWTRARPANPAVVISGLAAFGLMAAMAWVDAGGGGRGPSSFWLFLSGVAGASAMILPGVSGGYLLLLLGQYERILGAVDQVKAGLLGSGGPNLDLLGEAAVVVIPVGLGVVIGTALVSNGVRWLLEHHEKATLGALLGLLFGAVVGLWPFQVGVEPTPGETVAGQVWTAAEIAELEPEDWPVRRHTPTPGQAAGSLALVALGLGTTVAIGRLGAKTPPDEPAPAQSG